MPPLIPTSSACHSLALPPLEKDDRMNLTVRTGLSPVLYKSFMFVHGGLTLGLEVFNLTITEIEAMLYSALSVNNTTVLSPSTDAPVEAIDFSKYLSGELFQLNMIDRVWSRIKHVSAVRPEPRLFHDIFAFDNRLYLFGGLVLTKNSNKFVPVNDLWELDLLTCQWKCLSAASESTEVVPRYGHKVMVLSTLALARKPGHCGILIAGGKNAKSEPLASNAVFDLVEGQWLGTLDLMEDHRPLTITNKNETVYSAFVGEKTTLFAFKTGNPKLNPFIRFEIDKSTPKPAPLPPTTKAATPAPPSVSKPQYEKKLIVDSTTRERITSATIASIVSSHKPTHLKIDGSRSPIISNTSNITVPEHLSYPIVGRFGPNLVLTGFLPQEIDISVFIYNVPSNKWTRLNVMCNHEFGAHRFWGGFVWTSHHKVVLIGNYNTSSTTSSIRYFTQMITISLPIINVLHVESATAKPTHGSSLTSFDIYAQYSAPSSNLTSINSVFPPSAVTLGRNAFERYGYELADLEIISAEGDSVPVPLMLARKRWGNCFDRLLSKAYARALARFDANQQGDGRIQLGTSVLSGRSDWNSISTVDGSVAVPGLTSQQPLAAPKPTVKDVPQFRLPFQDKSSTTTRRSSVHSSGSSIASNGDDAIPTIQNLPPQQPMPNDPAPMCSASELAAILVKGTSQGSIPSIRSSNSVDPLEKTPHPVVLSLPQDGPTSTPSLNPNVDLFPSKSRRLSIIENLFSLRKGSYSESPLNSPIASPRGSISSSLQSLRPRTSFSMASSGVNFNPRFNMSSTNSIKSGTQGLSPGHTPQQSPRIRPRGSVSSLSRRHSSVEGLTGGLENLLDRDRTESTISHATVQEGSESPMVTEPVSQLHDGTGSRYIEAMLETPVETFPIEPLLVPRQLYLPFSTTTARAFTEFLYTGQVGSKWEITPTTLDVFLASNFYELPLLYDLISEVLYGVIGRKESSVLLKSEKLYAEIDAVVARTGAAPHVRLLDKYEGFRETVDDGYLDLRLLKRTSRVHRQLSVESVSSKAWSTDGKHSPEKTAIIDEEMSDKGMSSASEEEMDINLAFFAGNFKEPEKLDERADDEGEQQVRGRAAVKDEKARLTAYSSPPLQEDSMPTLEELASPDSPPAPDVIVDFIYEAAALANDMKLMLRAANCRDMTRSYHLEVEALEVLLSSDKPDEKASKDRRSSSAESLLTAKDPNLLTALPRRKASMVETTLLPRTPDSKSVRALSPLSVQRSPNPMVAKRATSMARLPEVTPLEGLSSGDSESLTSAKSKKRGLFSFIKKRTTS
ncbi:hypothetical protein BABINDRAFT_161876 [Babjeviella inositovora NRRL Y-12698]|uniref:Uncharacterized protein n=1 Tax=Babjeviella inositovora NRRL Y-12698 TaxID=984486 RepID=A0A1E3QPA0_9ASCO|nr:uncharacterized protein BABINDRAFT_161876 [Babjeviella inositovora NRRL Y-12698]ODQ79480.1 hypothetical protein BABINDRAFT_161876 [Babjeviella inositovora NRRL Y-12698]